jgi:DNA-binding NarL/FixJ family response regulator
MRLLIADDHPMVRDALTRALLALQSDLHVVTAGDFDSVVECLRATPPELAVIDLNMPGMDSLVGLTRLRRLAPTLPIVVVSGQDDPPTIRAALAAGAAGFVPKTSSADLLLQAVRVVLAGSTFVPEQALANLQHDTSRPDTIDLTPRQRDVLRALLRGEPNKLIARELGLTEGTVKIHIAAILRGLQARNRTEAVVRARELGFE